jgi:hypothetical protein
MKGELMIIERKFGELPEGAMFWINRACNYNERVKLIKDSKLNGKHRWADNSGVNPMILDDDTVVHQLITREEQIAALKAIEKPFSLWPEWLKTCEVFKELKDKEVWDWYSISCRWNCATIFYDDGNLVRLSPTYQDKEPEKPKEPKFTKHTISFELVEGEMKNLKFE